jgi:hypothetical protein
MSSLVIVDKDFITLGEHTDLPSHFQYPDHTLPPMALAISLSISGYATAALMETLTTLSRLFTTFTFRL